MTLSQKLPQAKLRHLRESLTLLLVASALAPQELFAQEDDVPEPPEISSPPDPYAEDPGTADPEAPQEGEPPASEAAAKPKGGAAGDAAPSSPSDPYASDYDVSPSATVDSEERASSAVPSPEVPSDDEEARRLSLREQNTLSGSSGLFRVRRAASGRVGTFRLNLSGGFFAGSGFLCTSDEVAPCTDPVSGFQLSEDSATRTEALLNLSVTPFPFLEGFASVKNAATSNSNGSPELLTVLGDLSFGAKGFLPSEPDRIFGVGGELELSLLPGTGGVGVDGGATSFAMRALADLELDRRTKPEDRFPFRAHLNLGYVFNNSSALISSLESTPAPVGRGEPIERTERYGLNISRVDQFEIGLGVEYVHDYLRPFAEWTLDVPVNRQGYVCNIDGATARGDFCLGEAAALNTSPNRLTIGARGYPWQESGLALTFAVDIGTGGTRLFLEETKPETPYMIWFGVAYAVDVNPIPPKVVTVMAPAPAETKRPPQHFIVGQVVSASGGKVGDAVIRFEKSGSSGGANFTGMVADSDGRFRSGDLPPGDYTFKVSAPEYKDGSCSVKIPEALPSDGEKEKPAPLELTEQDGATEDPPGEPKTATEKGPGSVAENENGDLEVALTCELKELPRVANVAGLLVDSVSGGPVPDATVTIYDKLNRSLTLAADAQGSLVFQNVPFGSARLVVSAPGYLDTVMALEIDSRKEKEVHVVMNKRPAKSSIEVAAKVLKLTRPIAFVGETAEISPDTMVVVEELAALLKEKQGLLKVEIGVHSDDSGAAAYARRLTQDRADAVRSVLVQLGVEEGRVAAKGYGPDQPLSPNVSDAARERNKRLEITIVEKR